MRILTWISAFFVAGTLSLQLGCAGACNSWNAGVAKHMGANWLVVQYSYSGEIQNYWEFSGSVSNEPGSDGIFFSIRGHVIHLSNNYVYAQDPDNDERDKLLKSGKYTKTAFSK